MSQLLNPKAPALPRPPEDYDPTQQAQLLNALRLYFNQIDSSFQQILLGFNTYGTFRAPNTLTNLAAVNFVPWPITDEAFAVAVLPSATEVEVQRPGLYKFEYALQLRHNAGSAATFHIWPIVNGTAVPNSAFRYVIENPTHDMLATRDYLVTLRAGDRFSLGWSSSEPTATLQATPAAPPVPAVPAATLTVHYLFPNGAV